MFSASGLTPGQPVGVPQMRQLLQHWFSKAQQSSLKALWQRGEDLQQRIAEIACTELDAWDATNDDIPGDSAQSSPISILAELRWHPLPRVELYLAVPGKANEMPRHFEIADCSDTSTKAAVELTGGQIRLEFTHYEDLLFIEPRSKIRIGDALLANIDLAPQDRKGPHLVRRRQPLLTLAFRDRYGAYREVSQAQLLERLIVLSHELIKQRIATHLQHAARPGFKEFDKSWP